MSAYSPGEPAAAERTHGWRNDDGAAYYRIHYGNKGAAYCEAQRDYLLRTYLHGEKDVELQAIHHRLTELAHADEVQP